MPVLALHCHPGLSIEIKSYAFISIEFPLVISGQDPK